MKAFGPIQYSIRSMIETDTPLVDRVYDPDDIVHAVKNRGMKSVALLLKGRKIQSQLQKEFVQIKPSS